MYVPENSQTHDECHMNLLPEYWSEEHMDSSWWHSAATEHTVPRIIMNRAGSPTITREFQLKWRCMIDVVIKNILEKLTGNTTNINSLILQILYLGFWSNTVRYILLFNIMLTIEVIWWCICLQEMLSLPPLTCRYLRKMNSRIQVYVLFVFVQTGLQGNYNMKN